MKAEGCSPVTCLTFFFTYPRVPILCSCLPPVRMKSDTKGGLNLDDMLSDLTSNPIADLAPGTGNSSAAMGKRKRGLVTPQSARSRRSSLGTSGSSASSSSMPRGRASLGGGGGGARRPPVPSSWTVRDYEDTEAGNGGEAGEEDDDDFNNETGAIDFGGQDDADEEEDGVADDVAMQDQAEALPNAGGAVVSDVDGKDVGNDGDGAADEAAAVISPDAVDEPAKTVGAAAAEAAVSKPRSRFARMKDTNDIAVTEAAEAALRPKPASVEKEAVPTGGERAAAGAAAARAGVGSNYMPSLDFQGPQYVLSEAPSTPASSAPNASAWLQKVSTQCSRESVTGAGSGA